MVPPTFTNDAAGPAPDHQARRRRWGTRAVGCLFLSIPLGLLLVWAGLVYVTNYGLPQFGPRPPAPNWKDPDLAAVIGNIKRSLGDRYQAARILGNRSPEVIPLLVPLLNSWDPMTRRLAVDALGNLGEGAKSVLPQVLRLTADADPDVAAAALQAAVDIAPGDERVATHLRSALRGSNRTVWITAGWLVGPTRARASGAGCRVDAACRSECGQSCEAGVPDSRQ